jgi:hypothetical protein
MAGGYTHLTIADELCSRTALDVGAPGGAGLLGEVANTQRHFVFLGAVSPDYPYFGKGTPWADRMHREKTDGVVLKSLARIREMRGHAPGSDTWRKCLAWLLGYVSHVAADVTIHPIVNLKVGTYELNKDRHRECEMHQDVLIYVARKGLDLQQAHQIVTQVLACNDPKVHYPDLDDDVEDVWGTALESTYGARPDNGALDFWHAGFTGLVSVAERGSKIPLIGRYLMNAAYAYPDQANLNAGYYSQLGTPLDGTVNAQDGQPRPGGAPMDFPAIFDKALGHARDLWTAIGDDLAGTGPDATGAFGDWSLDTGVDRATGRLRFWP